MNGMDNPIVQRWHYLEWLDNVMLVTFIVTVTVLCLASWFAYARKYKKLSGVLHFLGEFTGVLALLYIFWRVFFSWKGYYY
jgi:hypothetical protein